MTLEQRTTAAEKRYESGAMDLTPAELSLLSKPLQEAYKQDLADEAEHQALMAL